MNAPQRNWSGSYTYRARWIHRPRSVEELQQLVAGTPSLRALGSRHSFTSIADARELVSLAGIDAPEIAIDPAASTVRVPAAVTYAELAAVLNRRGFALHNLASLPHISVAGAVATASHGSGDRSGNLATAVREIELVTSTGELVSLEQGDREFLGAVVGLGALGIAVAMTLSLEPAFEMTQHVFDGLSWDALFEHFDAVTRAGGSVSVFHRFGAGTEQVWIKRRVDDAGGSPDGALGGELFGAVAASVSRHPIAGMDPVNTTEQLGVPGRWSERLPHFRSGFTPSSGEEIQSEFFVARSDAPGALDALRALAFEIRPLLLIAELRTIAADELWLSPHYHRDSVGLHFTWRRDQRRVEHVLELIESALVPFAPRPHWGKLFRADASTIAPQYERLNDFRALRDRLDPRRTFENDWLRRHLLGTP